MLEWISSRLARGSGVISEYAGRLQFRLRSTDLRAAGLKLEALACEPFGWRATVVLAAIFLGFASVFAWSGNFFVGLMLNDFFLISEIAYRYAHGEVAGHQFTNPMGVFAFAPQALVYAQTGDLVLGAIVAQIFYGLVVFGFAAYVSYTRLNFLVGAAITLTLSILMLAPWVLGSAFSSPYAAQSTNAMIYNRFGFIAVTLAALLAASPRPGRQRIVNLLDAPIAALLAVLAYYSKVPFGLAILCLVAFWNVWVAYSPRFLVRFAVSAGIIVIASEAMMPGLNLGYLAEQAFAGSVAGVVNLKSIVRGGIFLLPEVIPAVVLPLVLLAMHRLGNWRIQVYFACLVVGSLGLLTVSAQGLALVTPLAVGAYVLTVLMDQPDRTRLRGTVLAAGLGLATVIANYLPKSIATILQHSRDAASTAPIAGLPQTYSRLRVPLVNDLDGLSRLMSGTGRPEDAYRQARSHPPLNTIHAAFPDEYLATLVDLGNARALCGKEADRTAVTDFTNPSASLFGHRPVSAYAYLHFGRSFSHERHLDADRLFKDVNCIFDPKLPIEAEARDAIWDIYGAHLRTGFAAAGSTAYWRVYLRRQSR